MTSRLDQELDRLPKVSGPSGTPDQIYVTQRLKKLLTRAEDEAKRLKDDFISVEHVLLAATDDSKAFREMGVTRDRLMQALREVRGSQRITSKNPEATYFMKPSRNMGGIFRRPHPPANSILSSAETRRSAA